MFKKFLLLFICCSLLLPVYSCGSPADTAKTDKLQVYVTFNALKEFAAAVGGDKVYISTIIPDGTEPHDFEPNAQDLAGLSTAQIFIYNGLGMEAWVDDAIAAASNENLIAVDASKGISPIAVSEEDPGEHSQYDPHIWLSIKGAEVETENIKNAFISADPANKDLYEANCASYIEKLEKLYTEYTDKFAAVEKKNFVTGHAAFAYLCRDFGLTQNSVEDVFAEGEPTPLKLAVLVEYCRKNSVTTVFAEKLANPAISETLANEVGASVETVYTMESAEDNMTYIERMSSNLGKIFDSLSA